MWLRDGARPRFRHGFRAECAQYLFENIILSDSINIIIIMLITAGNTVLYYRIFVAHYNVTRVPMTNTKFQYPSDGWLGNHFMA